MYYNNIILYLYRNYKQLIMRVTIDIQYDVLKWIAHKAIDLGIPRKEYLELCVLAWYERETENGGMTPESVHLLNKSDKEGMLGKSLRNPTFVSPPKDEIAYIFNPHSTPEELQEKINESFKEIVESKLNEELDKVRDEQSDMSHLPITPTALADGFFLSKYEKLPEEVKNEINKIITKEDEK